MEKCFYIHGPSPVLLLPFVEDSELFSFYAGIFLDCWCSYFFNYSLSFIVVWFIFICWLFFLLVSPTLHLSSYLACLPVLFISSFLRLSTLLSLLTFPLFYRLLSSLPSSLFPPLPFPLSLFPSPSRLFTSPFPSHSYPSFSSLFSPLYQSNVWGKLHLTCHFLFPFSFFPPFFPLSYLLYLSFSLPRSATPTHAINLPGHQSF